MANPREGLNNSVRVEPVETRGASTLGHFGKLRTGFTSSADPALRAPIDKPVLSKVEGLSPNGWVLDRAFPSAPCRRSSGQATIEYLYVLPILLLLLLATLQFAFIYETKQTLNYATFAATRAGALHNGAMAAIQEGLTSGFAPQFVHDKTQQALKDGRATAKAELGDSKLTYIQILNPTSGALSGFANADGAIPNDNLMYRDPNAFQDGMNVQDANLLKVRVTYCVRLVVPIVNRMIYAFAVNAPAVSAKIDSASYSGETIAAPEMLKVQTGSGGSGASGLCVTPDDPYPYRLPVSSEAVVRMQSPFTAPGKWTAP